MIRKKRVYFTVNEEEWIQLKLRAERQYRSLSNYILRAVSSEVRKHAPSVRKINKAMKLLFENKSENSLIELMKIERTDGGYVYFIQEAGTEFVKIGYSKDPYQRIKGMTVDNPHDLELLAIIPGSRKLEKRLHDLLLFSLYGGEWFLLTNKVTEIIAAAKAIGNSIFYVQNGEKVKLFKKVITHVGKKSNGRSEAILEQVNEYRNKFE